MILGRLELVMKRGQSNPDRQTSLCRNRLCQDKLIEPGTFNLLLKKTFNGRWSTKRFHIACFETWLHYMTKYLEERGRKKRLPYVQLNPNVTSEDLITRRKLQMRKSYLIRRLRNEPEMPNETRQKLRDELERNESVMLSFGQYNRKWSLTRNDEGLLLSNLWEK